MEYTFNIRETEVDIINSVSGDIIDTITKEEFEDSWRQCHDCGKYFNIYDEGCRCADDDNYYCNACMSDTIVRCYHCDDYIFRENAYYCESNGEYYCECCCNDELYYCESCGRYFREYDVDRDDDGNYYCNNCWDSNRYIDEYHTFKEDGDYTFYHSNLQSRSNDLHMGFELECDAKRASYYTPNGVVKNIDAIFGKFVHYEHDGSLNNGFEIISHPATLEWLLEHREMFEKAFNTIKSCKFGSHDIGTCGLHVHVDKSFFGRNVDIAIAKIIFIFQRFWNNFVIFSRREENKLDRWASKYNDSIVNVMEVYKSGDLDRYHAVNLTNDDTIEFRIARGTLKLSTFFATLKLYNRICEIAKNTSSVNLSKMTWEDILGNDEEVLTYWKEALDRKDRLDIAERDSLVSGDD